MNGLEQQPESIENQEQAELERLLSANITALPPSRKNTLAMRLGQRAADSVAAHAGLNTVRRRHGQWRTAKPGVRFKPLWQGASGNSVLLELSPGASLPVHRHNWLEEGIVLRGGLQMGDIDLGVFDYHVSPAGSRHDIIRSRQGALAFLRGTALGDAAALARELLGGLLPMPGQPARSVFFDSIAWQPLQEGILFHDLYSDGMMASRFYRLEAGARLEGHLHPLDEECLMLSGEVFLGDILLCNGDYQLAPVGSQHGEIYTDVGAFLFVRGAVNG